MRGRRGPSSSSGFHQQSRMSLRKQMIKDVHSESQQMDEDTQEDEAAADRDDKDELSLSLLPESSAREQRCRERENKSKPKEMTEEEMMDLALRLSKEEANVSALRRREEEEAMKKAIEESMVDQSQPRQASQSQTLLANASVPSCPRRKLSYSNRKKSAAVDPETQLNCGAGGAGSETHNRNQKRTRKPGSPLPEMPDLSQNTCSQASPCSPECLSAHPDSPQSSDSTQIDDCQLRKSPVFPSTGNRAEVHVSRLTQDLLDTCRNSGFVLCSQDSWASTQIPAQPKSPTFPDSNLTTCPRSPVFSGADRGDRGEREASPTNNKSPVFGRNTQRETSPSACKPQVSVCSPKCENSGFSSQDSLTSTVRPKSPVFPRSPGLPTIRSEQCPKKLKRGPTEQSQGRSGSPVFGRTGRRRESHGDVEDKSQSSVSSDVCSKEDGNGDGGRVDGKVSVSRSSSSDEPKEKPNDWSCSETEPTSNMTLVLSDEDDDVTQVGCSPSPVFPEERPPRRAESQTASLNHLDSPETNCSLNPQRCHQSGSNETLAAAAASSSCTSRGAVGRLAPLSGEPAGGQTVHYYWGVPFCPRGLDPDQYTKVILAQMEVYEKSLKQAQRCLLRKAEWGEAVLPQPEKSPSPELLAESPQHHAPERRGLKLRGQKLSDEDESPPAQAEGEEEEEEERREKENPEKEGEKSDGDEGLVDVDDCEVCPETQLSDVTQDPMDDADAGAEPPPDSTDAPEVEMILPEDSPAADEPPLQEEEMEVDAPTDGKTEPVGSIDSGGQTAGKEGVKEDRADPDVEEVTGSRLQRSDSPELELTIIPRSPETAVDCPICQASFPASQIEMHAAYCDGEAVDRRRPGGSQVSLKSRRKRTRRAEATPDEANEPSNSGRNPEKCYICHKNVPLRDYNRHTELCIQRHAPKTAAKGNLLSALEKTESRDSDAGPSGSTLPAGDVIDLRDDDDEEEEVVSAFRISNSPIRSFTSISEATDCLIDFKKQRRAAKPSQRRR